MQLEIRSIVLVIVILGKVVRNLSVKTHSCLVSPAPSHILNRVATSTQHHQRDIPGLDQFDALRVTLDRAVVSTQLVIGQ